MSEILLKEFVLNLRERDHKLAGHTTEDHFELPVEVETGPSHSRLEEQELTDEYLLEHPNFLMSALFEKRDMIVRNKGKLAIGFGIAAGFIALGLGAKVVYDHREGLSGRMAEVLDQVIKRHNSKEPSS